MALPQTKPRLPATITPTSIMTTTDVDTRNESSTNVVPVSSSARHADTVNIGTSNTAGRDQYNITYQTNYYSMNKTARPSSSSGIPSSASFNDAPLGLLSAHFSGRQGELAHMIKAFEEVRGDMPTRFGLYAGPGVGKSQLTLALAKDSFAQGRYKYIFWIPATTVEKLYQGFSKLLHLVGHPDRLEPEEIVRLTAARRWLEEFTSERWLIVLDNVVQETVDFLREHLPRKNNHGNILFTTRTKDVAMALAHTSSERHEILELSIPDKVEAARLLLGHFEDGEIDRDENKVQELVKCVGCLPLAIAQAASYLRQTGSTLDALLTIYNSEHKIEMMEWENKLSLYQEKSVAATFTFQLDDLQHHFPDVRNLLKVLAYFDPERIPLDMLITGANILSKSQPQKGSDNVTPGPQKTNSFVGKVKNRILQSYKGKGKGRADETNSVHAMSAEMSSLLALIQSPTGLPNAIAQLQNRSLTRKQGSGPTSSLWMHDLTRLIILENTKKSDGELEWFEYAVELACGAFEQVQDPNSPQSWPQCEVLIPHIQSLTVRQGICGGSNSSLLSANHGIAEYLSSRGRYSDSEALFKQILSSREKQFGPEHVSTLVTKHELALVYIYQGRYSDAEVLFKQVLLSREDRFGPEHVSTLSTKHNLASVYESQGRYSDAEVLYKEVLFIREKQLGPDHVSTLATKNNLAGVYKSQGHYSDAEALFKQVLSGNEKQLGPEHISTLIPMDNLALVYNYQGRNSDAEVLYKQVLSSEEKQLGPEHVDTLVTKHNLALCYHSQGRYSDAEVLYKHVLSSREKQLGPEHVATLTTKHCLASTYDAQGRYSDAGVLYNQVLSSQEKQLGPEHADTLGTKHDLALVYDNQGRYSEAELLFKQVLSSEEKQLGPEHVETLKTKYCLASLYNSQDRYAEAEALVLYVLAGYEKWLGLSHPDTQDAQHLLADVYRNQGWLDDAEKMIQSVSLSPS